MNRQIQFLLGLLIGILLTVAILGQTVPINSTRQLQNGISIGTGLWAEPDPTLVGQAALVCAGTAGMTACINANNLIATDAQSRGLAFMNEVYKNYSGTEGSLSKFKLWFKGQ